MDSFLGPAWTLVRDLDSVVSIYYYYPAPADHMFACHDFSSIGNQTVQFDYRTDVELEYVSQGYLRPPQYHADR